MGVRDVSSLFMETRTVSVGVGWGVRKNVKTWHSISYVSDERKNEERTSCITSSNFRYLGKSMGMPP